MYAVICVVMLREGGTVTSFLKYPISGFDGGGSYYRGDTVWASAVVVMMMKFFFLRLL